MYQIYFLTVLANIVAGLTVSSKYLGSKIEGFQVIAEKMENRMFRIILGALTLLTGLFTLLSHNASSMAVLGDLIPSITAMALGIILVVYYFFSSDSEEENKFVLTVKGLTEKYGNIVGIAGILAGIIHFLVPTALFL